MLKNYSGSSKKPLVGYDCLALPKHFSGAAYYIYILAKKLLEVKRDFFIAVFCKPSHNYLLEGFLQPGDFIINIPIKNKLHLAFFYEIQLKKVLLKYNAKLFHATHYICPQPDPDFSIITTFHDMGFLTYPENYETTKKFYFNNRISAFLKRSDLILAVSNSTAGSIKRFFPYISKKVDVIYPGIDHFNSVITRKQFFNQPFLLSVNTFEKRKNIPFIIKVFNCLKKHFKIKHKLIIVGNSANDSSQIFREYEKSDFSKDIFIYKSISERELINFYQTAECFLNASEYEGFGFTPMEALRFNLPAFLYKNNVSDEFYSDYTYLIKNLKVDHWAKLIYTEMQNGYKNFKVPGIVDELCWTTTAEQTIKLYMNLLQVEGKILVST